MITPSNNVLFNPWRTLLLSDCGRFCPPTRDRFCFARASIAVQDSQPWQSGRLCFWRSACCRSCSRRALRAIREGRTMTWGVLFRSLVFGKSLGRRWKERSMDVLWICFVQYRR